MDKPKLDLSAYLARLETAVPARVHGRVREVTGLVIHATVPRVTVGEMVEIEGTSGSLLAQVVGFRDERVVLMPLGDIVGVGPNSTVKTMGEPLTLRCGPGLLGRVLDGLGRPIDGQGPIEGELHAWKVERPAPPAITRRRISAPFETGIRAIDGLMTVGEGQRIGLFAGSGVGKSTLMGQIARSARADVVVIGLVGERGRELRDFIEENLGPGGLERTVVVCATSDETSLMRRGAAMVATAVAEYFRDQGQRVLMMMDSLTRFARAQREIGLAAGEPPVRRGYPPSVFRLLPRLLERTGNNDRGSITALYTVLVEGDDMDEPIADEVRAILDGHIVLDRAIAERAHWPAVHVNASISRVMGRVVTQDHMRAANAFRRTLAAYESKRTLIGLGAYRRGSDPQVDEALDLIEEMEEFLQQPTDERCPMDDTLELLLDLFG